MSILNELKRIAKDTPNNQDLGAKLRGFLDSHKTCCDDKSNHKPFEYTGNENHRRDVSGFECKKCGKVINCKVER